MYDKIIAGVIILHTLRQLKNFDTIEITIKLSNEILDIYQKEPLSNINFFLNEGVLKCTDPELKCINYTYFKVNDKDIITIRNYFLHKYKLTHVLHAELDISEMHTTGEIKQEIIETKIEHEKIIYTTIAEFLTTFAYLTRLLEDRETVIKETQRRLEIVPDKPKKKKDKKRNFVNKRVVSLTTDKTEYITITTDIKSKNAEKLSKRAYTKHIESWTVRGHIRRYKSGKTVYIKPYVKGKGKKEPKIYKV